jgi:molybdenum cofactor cytidylyltransferase
MGDFKPLLPWKGTTLCGAVVDKALEAGLQPVLVTGFQAKALETAFKGRADLLLVHNPDWEAGMVGSIQVGCRAALAKWPHMQGVLVAPADMPELPVEAFRILAETGLASSRDGAGSVRSGSAAEHEALFAARNGRLGHPVWIPMQFMDDILSLGKGGQLRPFLLTMAWSGVEIDSDAIFLDLDTREDYRAHCTKG